MLVRITCALVAGLGFLAGFLLGARFAPSSPRTRPGLERRFAARRAPGREGQPNGRPAAAAGQRSPRKPVKNKTPSTRRKKNR